ncbi:MAG: hypothetical protein AB8H03_12235 [Saprospiraceae bacterium]
MKNLFAFTILFLLLSFFSNEVIAQNPLKGEVAGKLTGSKATLAINQQVAKSKWAQFLSKEMKIQAAFQTLEIKKLGDYYWLIAKDTNRGVTSGIQLSKNGNDLIVSEIQYGTVSCGQTISTGQNDCTASAFYGVYTCEAAFNDGSYDNCELASFN